MSRHLIYKESIESMDSQWSNFIDNVNSSYVLGSTDPLTIVLAIQPVRNDRKTPDPKVGTRP